MKDQKLTGLAGLARRLRMTSLPNAGSPRTGAGILLVAGSALVSGCISVNAPDKPIVIELNINISQEVVYRLAADAGNTIEENADIF